MNKLMASDYVDYENEMTVAYNETTITINWEEDYI